jgi:DNA polymerase-3 subunit epsilon
MYILWVDTETGGVNPARNALLTMAGCIEENGRILQVFDYKMQPLPNDTIEAKAMEVNKLTLEEIATYPESKEVYTEFLGLLDFYINKFDKNDKMVFAGYNAQFDKNFLYHWFKKHGNNYFFSYFYGMPMDIGSFVLSYCAKHDIKLPNHKLATVAKHFGFEVNFHEAMADIDVTRQIYLKLKEL